MGSSEMATPFWLLLPGIPQLDLRPGIGGNLAPGMLSVMEA